MRDSKFFARVPVVLVGGALLLSLGCGGQESDSSPAPAALQEQSSAPAPSPVAPSSAAPTPEAPSRDSAASPPSPEVPPDDARLTCRAAITPDPMQFMLQGDQVMLHDGRSSIPVRRLGSNAGSSSILDTWKLQLPEAKPSQDPKARPVAKVEGTLQVEANKVTVTTTCALYNVTLKVAVSSPATVQGTVVHVHEAHQEVREWTPKGGERVTEKK